MDKMANIKELLAEIDAISRQVASMKQRLQLLEATVMADVAALQASELRVKQLEMMMENVKSAPAPQELPSAPQEPAPAPQKPVPAPQEPAPEQADLVCKTSAEKKDARLINDLRKAIGLNDRFRLKHDLFDNNEMLLFETIDALNAMTNMTDADAYIKARFNWNADDATVVYFYEMLERKYFRS